MISPEFFDTWAFWLLLGIAVFVLVFYCIIMPVALMRNKPSKPYWAEEEESE